MIHNVLVAGGDGRMLALAILLQKEGFQVQTMGLLPMEAPDVKGMDAILLPYPFSVKEGKVPSLTGRSMEVKGLVSYRRPDTLVIAGRGYEEGLHYTQADGFEQRNAELSAEGAVYEVMQRSDRALMDLSILVTGYGRFGRSLAQKLLSLGAEIWVAARRPEAIHQAQADGIHAVQLSELRTVLPKVDFVLNTIPAQIITEEELALLKPDAWLMELASAPYGFDRNKAHEMGLKTALLPGIPSHYAPQSAALALKEAVVLLFREAER